jgi:hypothetical protein
MQTNKDPYMNDPKLCKDCAHIKRDFFDVVFNSYAFAECRAEYSIGSIDIVSGRGGKHNYSVCAAVRQPDGHCGPAATHFKEKQ